MQPPMNPSNCLNMWVSWHWTASWSVHSATAVTVRLRGESINTFLVPFTLTFPCSQLWTASSVLIMSRGDVAFDVCLHFHFSGTNAYIKAVYELSDLINLRFRTFPYHNDLIFYLSPHGFRYRKACRVAHGHTGKLCIRKWLRAIWNCCQIHVIL